MRTSTLRPDLVLALTLSVLATLGALQGMERLGGLSDTWFESDQDRVYENMTRVNSDHYRSKVHPLFPLASLPAVTVLAKLGGVTPLQAVRVALASVVFLWTMAFFALLRLLGCPRLDAVLFTAVALVSAASLFWFTVPETYSFGSLSIVLALLVVGLSEYHALSERWYLLTSAATLSMTVTNWMVGLVAVFNRFAWRKAVQISVNAFALVSALWILQKLFVPSAEFINVAEEPKYLHLRSAGNPLQKMQAFFSHSMVMPPIGSGTKSDPPWAILSVQHSTVWSGGPLGKTAAGLWLGLLGLGLWGLFKSSTQQALRRVIGLALLGQLALHLIYGKETFLYSLHYLPLLVLMAACGALTRARPLVLCLAGALVVTAGASNGSRFSEALARRDELRTPREEVKNQMYLRPHDPWPRSQGHAVIAPPGSRTNEKSYHEPGGSFSPRVGSFGVSVLAWDGKGRLLASSDNISVAEIEQSFQWQGKGHGDLPSISTQTPYYRTRWSLPDAGRWSLGLEPGQRPVEELSLMIRSVGPAGGPICALEWEGNRLVVNHRWLLTLDPAPAAVCLGEETRPEWLGACSPKHAWVSEDGWAYAHLKLARAPRFQLHIADPSAAQTSRGRYATRSSLTLSLPEPRFQEALDAQVAHLMMSLVGGETRSSDPVNTPIAWQRTGAYIITALARAGRMDVARDLSRYLAEHDFYGGFGAEADAPGLGIWALKEVASLQQDPEFVAWLWPHVSRKAALIEEMRSTKGPMIRKGTTPIVPRARYRDSELVVEPARDGLIMGRMDYQRPVLYVNAVSYRGLQDAAWFAERMEQGADAERWHRQAESLRVAWERYFGARGIEETNDRTYISALWPTGVADRSKDLLRRALDNRWRKRRDERGGYRGQRPLWTYFEIAEAHQRLYLSQVDPLWSTLGWFWDNQSSRGLYTWWEGDDEGNTFFGWHAVRGWVKPPYVTPHYWTNAEMLLLQLEMLAYWQDATNRPILVIGAGIPREWLGEDMRVAGLSTPFGTLDWIWTGERLVATIHGALADIDLRLGAAFPSDSQLELRFSGSGNLSTVFKL
ncbi:MAG: hypothetical protein ACREYF_14225 [Gammaproteobacteria bacterium]